MTLSRARAALLFLSVCILPRVAAADDAPAADEPPPAGALAKAVPDMPGKTWFDLLSQLFGDVDAPDTATAAATASDMNGLRSIGIADDSWNFCGGTIELTGFAATMIRLGEARRWVVTVQFADECAGLLALFDEGGKLIDAVNVKGDQHVSFTGDYVQPLGASGALVTAWNWHDNSDQSYDDPMLILAKTDGFSAIGSLPAFGSRGCRSQFTEEPIVTVAKTTPMARIDAKVKRRTKKFAADCETEIGRLTLVTFDGYWRWNDAKGAYEPHLKELDVLFDWNAKQD